MIRGVEFSCSNILSKPPRFHRQAHEDIRSKVCSGTTGHALSLLMLVIMNLVDRAHATRRTLLRDVAQEALLLFPTLVLGPQCHGATFSCVKTEVNVRLSPWRRRLLDELALHAKAQANARPSHRSNKTYRAARGAANLIHKQ